MKQVLTLINRSKAMNELWARVDNLLEYHNKPVEEITKEEWIEEIENVIWDLKVQMEEEVSSCDPYYPKLKKDLSATKRLLTRLQSM